MSAYDKLAYAYHKGKASAYWRAGNEQKARSHAIRAGAYRTSFGEDAPSRKTHKIFVLAPMSTDVQKKLELMLDGSGAFARTEVYIQGFSEAGLDLYTSVCGDESQHKERRCKNVLPAQFNQYCSDEPLALVRLINAHKNKPNVTFRIFPTQLTKNSTFDDALASNLMPLIRRNWEGLARHMRRKIAAWCTGARPKNQEDLKQLVSAAPAGLKMATLFDPFVAFVASEGNNRAYKYSLAPVDPYADPKTRMPRLSRGNADSVSAVYHKSEAAAKLDADKYAAYVAQCLTQQIDAEGDATSPNVTSIIQDWADWDNLIAAKCIMCSISGPVTLFSVGRPVASRKCAGTLDFAANYDGELVGGHPPSWPPCKNADGSRADEADIDLRKSDEEAVNVAATWVIILGEWLRKAKAKRTVRVVNCGYPMHHGMEPGMHSAIVDIFSVYPATQGEYVPLPDKYVPARDELRRALERKEPVDVSEYGAS
jgi:hypothetical protein